MSDVGGIFTLFVMTNKGFVLLDHMIKKYKFLIDQVIVGSDKSLTNDYCTEIIQLCEQNSIPFKRKSEFHELKTKYALAVSWRWMITIPEDRLIIFHDSLLPRYRGFAPLVNSLINEENFIGVTALFGNKEYDRGNIIYQSKSEVVYPITIEKAILINNRNYIICLDYICQSLLEGSEIKNYKQDESNASYSVWRDDSDYKIDWSKSASYIKRFIDAVGSPYRGSYTTFNGRILRITNAQEVPDVKIENRDIGKVLFIEAGYVIVICGTGLLKIIEAYWEGEDSARPFYPVDKFRMRFI